MSRERLTVAAVQMSSQDDLAKNLSVASARVEEGARRGASLVVLPENFAFMGTEAEKRALAESLDDVANGGPILRALSEAAKRSGVWVIGGGLPERSGDRDRPFNTCAVLGPDGSLVARYRKVHLFDVDLPDGSTYRESASTSAGGDVVVVAIDGWNVGLSVCYDVRFPELYRALSERGAEAIVVPAAFTLLTGKDHWHVLLRARAIEAQAYVVAPAQGGTHPRGRQTYGKSLVADPWGEVVAQASEGEALVMATLERAYLDAVRGRVPSLRHRRM